MGGVGEKVGISVIQTVLPVQYTLVVIVAKATQLIEVAL